MFKALNRMTWFFRARVNFLKFVSSSFLLTGCSFEKKSRSSNWELYALNVRGLTGAVRFSL
jgi:hypothetical protein